MKKYISLSLVILLAACGSKNESVDQLIERGDLTALRAAKETLTSQQIAISKDLSKLEATISDLSPEKNLPLVTALSLKTESFEHFIELQGNVTTKENILISAEAVGTLQEIFVKKGDWVQKGDLLAKIDAGGLDNQLEQLRATANLAKTTYERQERLWEQHIGSEIQYLQAKAQFEAQQNAFEQMEKMLAKTEVVAPFSGVIDQLLADPGSLVSPGMGGALFRLINLSNMYVVVDVPERYISSIKKGNPAKVHIPVIGKTIATTIRETGNFVTPSNRSFEVELGVPNADKHIKPNLNARVLLNDYKNEKAILIPESIISENASGQQYVYVLSDHNGQTAAASRRIITTGETSEDQIEVISGLAVGDQVVVEGARRLKDGQRIKIIEE